LNAELQNGIRSEDLTALEMATSRRKRRRRHRQRLIAPRVRAGISSTSHSRPTTRRCNNRYRRTTETQIAVFRKTLADKTISDDIRSYDLAWLLHLVGDVHQPLHATAQARIAALHSMLV
jgi:S1/P1 Nuclease